jgi:hypothetical protein
VAIVGRALRQKMIDDATANSPERVAERKRLREIGEQVSREIVEKFPGGINAENADEVLTWQAKRLRDLRGF